MIILVGNIEEKARKVEVLGRFNVMVGSGRAR